MKAKKLGRKLRKERNFVGLSRQEVADAMGLKLSTVAHWEAGSRALSETELERLSELYRNFASNLLHDGAADEEDLIIALFRKLPFFENMPAARDWVSRWITLCRERTKLRQILGTDFQLPRPPWYEEFVPPRWDNAVAQGERIAEQERWRLKLGSTPIDDVVGLIASQGILVSAVELPDEIRGVFLNDRSIGLAIILNNSHKENRKRFSCALSYAHVLLDREKRIVVSSNDNSTELLEERANAFASAFLIPRKGILKISKNLDRRPPNCQDQTDCDVLSDPQSDLGFRSVSGLSKLYGVSYGAAKYRRSNLHILAGQYREIRALESRKQKYQKTISRKSRHFFQDEDEHLICDEIVYLSLEAYCREKISSGRLLKLGRLLSHDEKDLFDQANSMLDE